MSNLKLAPNLRQEIGVAQVKDNDSQDFKRKMLSKEQTDFRERENGSLHFRNRICVLDNETLRKQILAEVQWSRYTIHPGEVKMYKDLRRAYWWPRMNKDVT
jgi:hypothetical protein